MVLGPPRRRGARGFSLLELLVVMAIIMILLGISAGAYWSLNNQMRRTGSVLRMAHTLRTARNFAVSSAAPAEVRIEKQGRKTHVWAVGLDLLGQWHLEDGSGKGFGPNLGMIAATGTPQGHIKGGVEFEQGGHLDLGSRHRIEQGGMIEAWFYPTMYRGNQVLFQCEKAFELVMADDGTLSAWAGRDLKVECTTLIELWGRKPKDDKKEDAKQKARKLPTAAHLKRGTYYMPLLSWTKVALRWLVREDEDGESTIELAILVDDIIRAEATGPGSMKLEKNERPQPIRVSAPQQGWAGRVDEVRLLMAVYDSDPWELPGNARTEGFEASMHRIHFDAQGHLDPRYHRDTEQIVFVVDRTRQATFTLGRNGLLQNAGEIWSTYKPPPPPPKEEETNASP